MSDFLRRRRSGDLTKMANAAVMAGAAIAVLAAAHLACAQTGDPSAGLVLDRGDATVVLQPYAPNIVRITMSTDKSAAMRAPGYGFVAKPEIAGWTHEHEADGSDVYRSARLVVRVAAGNLPADQLPHALPMDALNYELRRHYFGGPDSLRPRYDPVQVTTTGGKALVHMRTWSMFPTQPDPAEMGAKTWRIGATFDSPAGEHYYGLGQQQKGWMDLRDHRINCWQDYGAIGGEDVCVPFLVSSNGYGLVWDNPSKTTVDLGFNQRNVWSSEVGDRVSYFVIAGNTTDEIYEGYRLLTGATQMLPRQVYGYIQSKAIYATQKQLLDVANEYRKKNLPLGVMVVDFMNMTKSGQMDLDPKRWPDPAAMNRELHAMGVGSLLSVWPHFAPASRFYDMLASKGWLIHMPNGQYNLGVFTDRIGPNIDTTNPAAAKWFWDKIRDCYVKPYGFDYIWLDETEPDIDPARDVLYVGSGTRYYNVYPLFHTSAVYEGFRRDFGDSRRVMILARAAYLGAQRNGTVFWSSDIQSTWDMLRRSIPAGLNFTASGMPYWDTDIGGFSSPQIPPDYHPAHKPLVDGSDAREVIDHYQDYSELFVRWFEWGAFQPVMRAHGERMHNEVWSYGSQAEAILSKYLRLRYQLLPYIYSLGYHSYQTGAPFMRALFMDFPKDPNVANIGDEYMFGPGFLVAPVTAQGATSREVYLPSGCDWYNYWTNERLHGGQTIQAAAPIDTIPLFVRAGSIVPLGAPVLSTKQPQAIASVRVYPGADGDFTLFTDDGTTYAYEKGAGAITKLHWDDARRQLTHTGAPAWSEPDAAIVDVVR